MSTGGLNKIIKIKYFGSAPLSRVGRETGDKDKFLFGLNIKGPLGKGWTIGYFAK